MPAIQWDIVQAEAAYYSRLVVLRFDANKADQHNYYYQVDEASFSRFSGLRKSYNFKKLDGTTSTLYFCNLPSRITTRDGKKRVNPAYGAVIRGNLWHPIGDIECTFVDPKLRVVATLGGFVPPRTTGYIPADSFGVRSYCDGVEASETTGGLRIGGRTSYLNTPEPPQRGPSSFHTTVQVHQPPRSILSLPFGSPPGAVGVLDAIQPAPGEEVADSEEVAPVNQVEVVLAEAEGLLPEAEVLLPVTEEVGLPSADRVDPGNDMANGGAAAGGGYNSRFYQGRYLTHAELTDPILDEIAKLTSQLRSLDHAMIRDAARLNADVPSHLVVAPVIRAPQAAQFSDGFFTDTDEILLTASRELSDRVIKEMETIRDNTKRRLQELEESREFTTRDEEIVQAIVAETSRPQPPALVSDADLSKIHFLVPPDTNRGQTFINPNPEVRRIYATGARIPGNQDPPGQRQRGPGGPSFGGARPRDRPRPYDRPQEGAQRFDNRYHQRDDRPRPYQDRGRFRQQHWQDGGSRDRHYDRRDDHQDWGGGYHGGGGGNQYYRSRTYTKKSGDSPDSGMGQGR